MFFRLILFLSNILITKSNVIWQLSRLSFILELDTIETASDKINKQSNSKKEDDADKKPSTQIQDKDNNVLAEDKIM